MAVVAGAAHGILAGEITVGESVEGLVREVSDASGSDRFELRTNSGDRSPRRQRRRLLEKLASGTVAACFGRHKTPDATRWQVKVAR